MKISTRAARVLLLAGAVIFCFDAAQAAPPPTEAFGTLPQAEDAQLSPDGKHLAVIKPVDGKEKVVFIDLTKPDAAPYVVGMQGGLAGAVHWKSNSRAICVFYATMKFKLWNGVGSWSRALSVDVTTQTATLMLYNAPFFKANYDSGFIADMAATDPDHVYMTQWNIWDRQVILDLYRVDVATGGVEMALHGNNDTVQFLTDGFGHTLGRIEQDTNLTNHVLLDNKDVYQYDVRGGSNFEIEGLVAGDGSSFAAGRTTPNGTTGLYLWSAAGIGRPLFENPTYDREDLVRDAHNGRIIGVSYVDDVKHTKYFDPDMQRLQDSLAKDYPAQTVTILSKDDAGSVYAIKAEGPKNPPVISLYTVATHQSKVISDVYNALKPSDLGEVTPYLYKARDGLDIHAYLTLPPGRPAHNLPTVIFPHGGPEDRDRIRFDWWAQFMATRGYAVLQPNFRGSSGYGWDFVKAGDGEWGRNVQYDVQDGVKKLIADGIADPKRICIVGASYGGYMALAGATFSPDLYACAVSFAGISDLDQFLIRGESFESESSSVWKRRIGSDVDSTKGHSQSPANFAADVKIPVLLIHCDLDATVPIRQSEIEEDALKHAGKQVEFVKLEGDDHYLEFSETRIKMLNALDAFLSAHIGK